tara:strand:- start:85 stop:282 length:198 start_codon:yes stop_codon:yes gene_type:complete
MRAMGLDTTGGYQQGPILSYGVAQLVGTQMLQVHGVHSLHRNRVTEAEEFIQNESVRPVQNFVRT